MQAPLTLIELRDLAAEAERLEAAYAAAPEDSPEEAALFADLEAAEEKLNQAAPASTIRRLADLAIAVDAAWEIPPP